MSSITPNGMPSQLRGKQKKKDPANVLTERIAIRVSKDEYQKIAEKAQKKGLTRSDFCRRAALRLHIRDMTPEQQKYRQIVSNGCTNMNRYMELVNKYGINAQLNSAILGIINDLHQSKLWKE